MRFLKFVGVGACAATINFGSRVLFSCAFPYSVAIVMAFGCGLSSAFILNRLFVFSGATSSLHRQMFWFVLVNLFALVQTLGVSLLARYYLLPFVGWTWAANEIAHAFGVAVPIGTSYIGHKHLSFRVATLRVPPSA